ncbi:MAG: AAA family ATPase [Spirochaetes bacterium]|nr:AAA family ATPase [Spirochaetota bacterium]
MACVRGLCRGSEQNNDSGPITIGENDLESGSEQSESQAPITIGEKKTTLEPITIGPEALKPGSEQALESSPITIEHKTDPSRPITIGPTPPVPGSEQPKKQSAESERRLATVMFADISGFTAMSEKMDPEQVTGIMNGVFREMEDVIKAHGGTIDKFIGDCVMVLFGVPRALENAPLMAVNTAIEMRNTLYRFNKVNNLAIPLDIHIGMNTGPVIAGQVGGKDRTDFTVMGDTVNLASRIEGASEKGQILMGPETYRATRDDFEYRALPPVSLKGKSEPVPTFELLSVMEKTRHTRGGQRPAQTRGSEQKSKTGPDRMIYSELVGRDEEMNDLRFQVMKLIKGEGGIVTIVGEAGIGKSRLMAELKADPAMKQVTLLEGRAVSMGRSLSFHPIIDLLKSWAGIAEDDGETVQFTKLEKAIRSIHPDEAEEIIPFAGTLMGMKLSGKHAERVKGIEGEAMEKLIFKNIRELLIKGSTLRPMVVYIEDFHWADTSSIELLSALFKLVDNYRILYILVFRPNYVDTSDRILTTLASDFPDRYMPIVIEPLTELETRALIGNLMNIRGLPRQIEEQIKERAGGNPFFVEEVVRSFIDEGAVIRKGDTFEVTARIHNVTVPLTINEVLMGRIDRLDEETKILVKTASVIGRNFFHKIITEVAQNVSDIDRRLSYLEDIQLIRKRKRLDEIEYLFKHALAQEAAYESILIQKRKELHLYVAHAIESVFTERLHEFYGMLAYHYSNGDNPDKAEEYMLKAGEEAMKASASSEALGYYSRALELYRNKYKNKSDPEKIAMIEKNIALAYFYRSDWNESLKYFRPALEFYWGKFPRSRFGSATKTVNCIAHHLISLYMPLVKWKRVPSEHDVDNIRLFHKMLYAVMLTQPWQFFINTYYFWKYFSQFNFRLFEFGVGILATNSVLFSYTGISFSVSKMSLKLAEKNINPDNTISILYYTLSSTIFNVLSGNWIDLPATDDLVKNGNDIGEYINTASLLFFESLLNAERGNFSCCDSKITKLEEIYLQYSLNSAKDDLFWIKSKLLQIKNKTGDCAIINEGINHIRKHGSEMNFLISLYSAQSYTSLLNGKLLDAQRHITEADSIYNEYETVPIITSDYFITKLIIAQQLMEHYNIVGDIDSFRKEKQMASRFLKIMIRHARKNALCRTRAYRVIGTHFWLLCKKKKSIRWWKKTIYEGERLGARPELSRTYFEVGKRLLEKPLTEKHARLQPKARVLAKKIIGLTPEECLERARTMFQEMDLQWDLEQLETLLNNIKMQNH